MLERGQRSPLPATADILAGALQLGAADRSPFLLACRTATREAGRQLIGREREMHAIERQLRGEGPPALLIAGEPGIGKTQVLREGAIEAESYGFSVLEGGCLRRGGSEPYAPLLQALQGYIQKQSESRLREDLAGCAWLVRLLPELAEGPIEPLPDWSIPAEQGRRLMDEAIVRFLGKVAGPGGTILVLDDLQWVGTDALDVLRMVLHSGAPVRLLGGYRENEIGSHHPFSVFLADLAHDGLVSHLRLGPLTNAEAAELLDRQLDGEQSAGGEVREHVLRRADGVPFFVVSCAQSIRVGAFASDERGDIPWDLTQSIRQRVAALPGTAQDVLGRAAIVGRRAARSVLIDIGEDEAIVLGGLDAACAAQLLEESDAGGYQFTHDVVREVVEADLGAARRTVLHRQIGEALERRGAPVEVLAYHFARSSDDARAERYLERAGDKAEVQHANATSEGYYRELIDRLDLREQSGIAAGVREKLAGVLTTVARYEDALTLLKDAAHEHRRVGDSESEARVMALMGRIHYLQGSSEVGIPYLESMRSRLDGTGPSRALAALDTALAPLYLARGRYREQLEASERAAEMARVLSDQRLAAEAEVWRGCALNQLGRLDEGRRVQEAGIQLAEAANDLSSLAHGLNDMGFLCEINGEFARSRTYKSRALDVARRIGDPAAVANMAFRFGQNAFLSGDWALARQHFEEAIASAHRVDALSILSYPLFGRALLALAEGDRDLVLRHAEQCRTIAVRSEDQQMLRSVEVLLAETALQDGRPEEACRRLDPLDHGESGLELHSTLPTLAEASLLMGDSHRAQCFVDDGIQQAQTKHNRVGVVDLLRVRALCFMEEQQWDLAGAAIDEALEQAVGMPYPYAEGRLLHVRGVLAALTDDPKLAREVLNHALVVFRRLGARWHEGVTSQMLSSIGQEGVGRTLVRH